MADKVDLQFAKGVVRKLYEGIEASTAETVEQTLQQHLESECLWRGMHPFYEQTGSANIAISFWAPFLQAFSSVQRREDVFMAGLNEIDGFESTWVCSMGHLMGLFDRPWLNIPPTGKMTFLRYVEFNKVEQNGKISETAMFCDVISVMKQAGCEPLPPQTGAFFITPGPKTHDGLLYDAQDPAVSKETLDLINRMIIDLTTADNMGSPQDQLAETWHEDMIWFGPAGIGATYTRERYEKQHQGPFSDHLDDIIFHGHLCRFAEGNFGGFFGWPNLTMKPGGNYMGLPASDKRVEMRVVDIYRRDGDKLAENWIFIDILHYLYMQGLDVLGRMEKSILSDRFFYALSLPD